MFLYGLCPYWVSCVCVGGCEKVLFSVACGELCTLLCGGNFPSLACKFPLEMMSLCASRRRLGGKRWSFKKGVPCTRIPLPL